MTVGIKSAGVDLDSIFDPYVSGSQPASPVLFAGGMDIRTRYAPLSLGTAAPATGILVRPASAGSPVDLNTLFAAYGTAAYSLPINGGTFPLSASSGTSSRAQLAFNMSSGTSWAVVGTGIGTTTPATGTYASGTIPTGASTVKYSYSVTAGGGGVVANGASAATAVGSNPAFSVYSSRAGSGPSVSQSTLLTIIFYNGIGTAISTTTVTFSTQATA